jgi:hypothetical protein
MMTGVEDEDTEVDAVLALERELQSPLCRSNPDRLRQLIADDFTEIGASGRVWDPQTIMAMLDTEAPDDPAITIHDLTGRHIADGVVLARWDSERAGRRARRTSLWRRDQAGWRLVHHQGTPLP